MEINKTYTLTLLVVALFIAGVVSSCNSDDNSNEVAVVTKSKPKNDTIPLGNSFKFLRVGNKYVYNSTENGVLATSDTLTIYLYNLKSYYCLRKMNNLMPNPENKRPNKVYEELFFIKNVNHVLVGREHYYKVDTLAKLNPPPGETWKLPRDSVSSAKYKKFTAHKLFSYFGPHRFNSDLTVSYTGQKKVVNVPAGTFECIVFNETSPDSSLYGYTYFNNYVGIVKRVLTYNTDNTQLTRETYLIKKIPKKKK